MVKPEPTSRQAAERKRTEQERAVVAFFIGVLAVLMAIAVALMVAVEQDWADRVVSELSEIQLPSLNIMREQVEDVKSTGARLGGFVEALKDNIDNRRDFATGRLTEHSAQLGNLSGRVEPPAGAADK